MTILGRQTLDIDSSKPPAAKRIQLLENGDAELEFVFTGKSFPVGSVAVWGYGPADDSFRQEVELTTTEESDTILITVPQAKLATSGTFRWDLRVTENALTIAWVYGAFKLVHQAGGDGNPFDPSIEIDWQKYTYDNTTLEGPYIEGVGISFGTPNADGQVAINLTGGAGGNIEDSTTAETDTTKIIQPDGVGGVAWVPDTGGGGGHIIEDEGTPLTQRESLNFIGPAITATDNAGTDATDVTIDVSDKASATDLSNHIADVANPHATTATLVPFTPSGNTTSDNVQLAIQEVQTDLDGDRADLTDHEAETGADAVHGSTDANTANAIVARDANGVTILSGLQLDTAESPGDSVGQIRWNDSDKCIEYNTENGTTIQVGQELGVYARNSTGSTIDNGSACYVSGATGNRPTVALANADAEMTADTTIGLCTGSAGILNNGDGFITTFGLVRGLNTLGLTEGNDIYLSDSVAGTWTQTEPTADASYVVRLGVVTRAHATLGEVLVNVTSRGTVIAENFRHSTTKAAARATIDAASPAGVETLTNKTIDGDLNTITNIGFPELDTDLGDFVEIGNGMALDSPSITVSSNGAVIDLSIEKSGGGDIRFQFSDGIYTLDTTPVDNVPLTAGSDAAPQINFVYLLQSNKALTVDTNSWPAEEHAPIATVLCQTAASLQTDGAYKVHQWTDHATSSDDQGHIAHLNSWIRQQAATWVSGVATTPTAGAAQLDVATSSGVVLQLHDHAFPAFNTATGSEIYVVNDPDAAYTKVANLTIAAGVDKDANGVTLGDVATDHYNLVLWGVVNEASGDCKLMCNLPTAAYANNNAGQAVDDVNNTAVYVIPSDFTGVGFLIARLTIQENGGTYTVLQNEDLRGLGPSTAAGGGATGGNEFADNVFRVQDDVDSTKELAFQVSGVTTATTRTLTVPDKDGTIATLADITGGGGSAEIDQTVTEMIGVNGLDQVATTAVSVGSILWFQDADSQLVLQYHLASGTDAEELPFLIRPDDYAATTNEKVWKLLSAAGSDGSLYYDFTDGGFRSSVSFWDGERLAVKAGAITFLPAKPILDNALAYYKLDEDVSVDGYNSRDMVGGYTVDDVNNPTSVVGKVGNARDFNGTNNYLKADAGSHPFCFNDDLTVAGWFNPDAIVNSRKWVAAWYGAINERSWFLGTTSGGGLAFAISPEGTTVKSAATTAPSTGVWTFIAGGYDATNDETWIYKDGVKTVGDSSVDGPWAGASVLFTIGRGADPDSHYDGKIDELGIWNATLTTTQLDELKDTWRMILDVTTPQGIGSVDIGWGSPINITSGETLVYNGWPWNLASYDAGRDRVVLGYTSGSVHNEEGDPIGDYDKIPRCMTKPNASTEDMAGTSNTFGSPVAMVPSVAGQSAMSQAMRPLSGGNYVGIVGYARHPNWFTNNETATLVTSTDGGATWSSANLQDGGGDVGSSYPCGLFETSSGRIIHINTNGIDSNLLAYDPRVLTSDTGGNPFTRHPSVNFSNWPFSTSPNRWTWEPEMIQLSSGDIVAVFRSTKAITSSANMLYSVSKNDGETWTPLKETNINTCANPMGMTHLPDGQILCVVGSRASTSAGVYACLTTESRLIKGEFGPMMLLVEGSASSDFGYPTCVCVGNRIWVYYYASSGGGRVDVFEMRGLIA